MPKKYANKSQNKKIKKFDKLVFFILIASITLAILKTIVFINSFNKKIILVIYLWNLFHMHIRNNGKRLIKTFISIFILDIKVKYLKKFYNNNTKI